MDAGDTPQEHSVSADGRPAGVAAAYQRDFWIKENLKHAQPHYRLRKTARIVNAIADGRECDLLDLGCGPATLRRLLAEGIHYYGIDIAIQAAAPYLLEADILRRPIA